MKNDTLSMFLYYARMTIKSWSQYMVYSLLRSLAVFLRYETGIIVICLTLSKFGNTNRWNINEMIFLFGILSIINGTVIILFTGLRVFEWTVQQGSFDRFIVRPRGLLFQVISSNADWFAAAGHVFFGVIFFILSVGRVEIVWDVKTIIFYFSTIPGVVLILGAIFLFSASLNFYYIKADNMMGISSWNIKRIWGPPNNISNKVAQWLLVYILPFTLVNYVPAQIISGKLDVGNYSSICIYSALPVGVILYLLSYAFWRYSIRFYKSTGN